MQKDVEFHNLSNGPKISVQSVYIKVLEIKEKRCLECNVVKGDRFAEKRFIQLPRMARKEKN